MAGGIDWFRWHHGSVTDPKFQLVAKRAGASLPDVLAVWAYLLEGASAATERGHIGGIDCEAVDCLFGFDDGVTALILDQMRARELICDGVVMSWEKRQPKREREDDNAAERKRRQRETDAAIQNNVTPCHAMSHQETPREEKRREEEKEQKTTAVIASAASAKPPRAVRKCPESFFLTAELLEFAAKFPAVDCQAETEKLRDHTFKNAISDWPGAWRNWIRRAAENAHQARASPMSFAERDELAAIARVHEMTGGLVSAKPFTPRRPDALQEVFDARTAARKMDHVAVRSDASPLRLGLVEQVERG